MKVSAYIDGFNLYKSALEKRPELKWLDLKKYCQSSQPENTLDQVFYFTARIKERFKGDDAPRRQHAYLRALEATGVTIILGRFTKDCDWLRLNSKEHRESIEPNLHDSDGSIQSAFDQSSVAAEPDSIRANIWKFGEKGSDVNLASSFFEELNPNKFLNFQLPTNVQPKRGKLITRPVIWQNKSQ